MACEREVLPDEPQMFTLFTPKRRVHTACVDAANAATAGAPDPEGRARATGGGTRVDRTHGRLS